MDPMIVQYLLFVLVAFCLIGAVIALNRWLYRHSPSRPGGPQTWIKLDPRSLESRRETAPLSSFEEDEEDDEDEVELHVRASQNGHSSNGHKPQL